MGWLNAESSPSRRLFVASMAALFATGAKGGNKRAPGIPRNLRVRPGNGSAVHTFDPPSRVGAGVTSYEIETKRYWG